MLLLLLLLLSHAWLCNPNRLWPSRLFCSWDFPRQEYWGGFPFPSLRIFLTQGPSWSRDWTCVSCVSCIGSWILYHWATREAPQKIYNLYKLYVFKAFQFFEDFLKFKLSVQFNLIYISSTYYFHEVFLSYLPIIFLHLGTSLFSLVCNFTITCFPIRHKHLNEY